MMQDLEQLLTLAQRAGAETAEVYYSRSLSHPVFFEANRLKQLESSESEGTALRLWRNGCPGLAVAYGPVVPQTLVEKAIALSALNPPETPEINRGQIHHFPPLGQVVPVEELIALGKTAIAELRGHYPDVLCSSELECEEDTTILINTEGLHCEYQDLSTSYYFGVEWVRGEDFLAVYDGEYGRTFPPVAGVLQQILQRLAWAKDNASTSTGKLPMIFTPNAATLLWGTLMSALNSQRIVEKSSPWSDKAGQIVLPSCFTFYQDPTFSPHDCPFDDEGTLTQYLPLITQGRIENFYSDLRSSGEASRATARQLGLTSTGNGFRPGLGGYPIPSLVNWIVEPGQNSLAELIAQVESGLLIDQCLGGGPDISGDFDLNVDLGYRIEKGEIVGRIKDTMITGNVYQVLQQTIALGNDRQWNGSCYTPSLLIEGISAIS